MPRLAGRLGSLRTAVGAAALALLAACSQGSSDARRDRPTPDTRTANPAASPDAGRTTTMTPDDHPGGTSVDEDGNLLRGKPENAPPQPAYPAALLDDHDAHLLFYAASTSGDQAMMKKAWTQLGLADAAGAPNDKLGGFIAAHQVWIKANPDRVQTVASAAKAKEYLATHLR